MKRINIDSGWILSYGLDLYANQIQQEVDLPHDCMIGLEVSPDSLAGAANGFYPGCSAVYEKSIFVSEDCKNKRVMLEIDGAYMHSEVYINGQLSVRRPYGYTPFHADLTPYIECGSHNEIKISINNEAVPNSRWYSGAGLYRHVDLLTAGEIHIAPWGVYAYTEYTRNGDAMVSVCVTVENHSRVHVSAPLKVTILDADGSVAITGQATASIPAQEQGQAKIRMLLENAQLWDTETPYLYTVRAELVGEHSDRHETTFGVRTITVDIKNGFQLNGKSLKLKGGCIHHDNGIIGAAAFDFAEYRKVLLHKQNGYNALRSAHNPTSRGMLEACDKLGVLLIDEAFDMWNIAKSKQDYHLHFEKWWQCDLDAMILRDRTHPCVIMWSIGNEIPEHGGDSNGAWWAQRLCARIRELDMTRPITSAVNNIQPPIKEMMTLVANDFANGFTFTGPEMKKYNHANFFEKTEGFCAPLDVVGYNYIDYLYEQTIERYPHRILCGTESFPMEADLQWAMVQRFPNLIGDFTWTSFDYIGEAGIGRVDYTEPGAEKPRGWGGGYPWRLANDADFDICGFDRPQLHYRKIVWGASETYLAVHNPKQKTLVETVSLWGWPEVKNHWTWPGSEGMMTDIDVYSSADEVELFVNGVSVGSRPAGQTNRYKARFQVAYEPGEICAISYTNQQEVSRDVLKTAGKPVGLLLMAEKETLIANEQDLCYVAVQVVDGEGQRVPHAEIKLSAKVTGAVSLAGFGSAAPITTENYTKAEFTTFEGRLLAVLRASGIAGVAEFTVSSQMLNCAELKIEVV